MPIPKEINKAIAVWRLCSAAEYCLSQAAFSGRLQHVVVAEIIKTAGMSRRSYYEFFANLDHQIERMHFAAARAAEAMSDSWKPVDLAAAIPTFELPYLFSLQSVFTAELVIDHIRRVNTWGKPRPIMPLHDLMDAGKPGGMLYGWSRDIIETRFSEVRHG